MMIGLMTSYTKWVISGRIDSPNHLVRIVAYLWAGVRQFFHLKMIKSSYIHSENIENTKIKETSKVI